MLYRQGDVLIRKIRPNAKKGAIIPRDKGRVVLAYGEATGHTHAIAEAGAILYATPEAGAASVDIKARHGGEDNARLGTHMVLEATEACVIRHPEHNPIELPPGTYEIVRQREWAGEGERMVED